MKALNLIVVHTRIQPLIDEGLGLVRFNKLPAGIEVKTVMERVPGIPVCALTKMFVVDCGFSITMTGKWVAVWVVHGKLVKGCAGDVRHQGGKPGVGNVRLFVWDRGLFQYERRFLLCHKGSAGPSFARR